MISIRVTEWRDNNHASACFSEDHADKVRPLIDSLRNAREWEYASFSIVWGNYPEMTPEETASAALDGYEVPQ